MVFFPNDFQQLVLEDIKTYEGLTHPVKASLLERVFRRRAAINKLHPNPDDEFSKPDVGPGFEIVKEYETEMRRAIVRRERPIKGRVCVEKMSVGGYMLLDGHHRWLAAHRVGLSSMPVQILNVTPVEKIKSAVAASDRRMCVSFDFDEVLLADGKNIPAHRFVSPTYRIFAKRRLRLNAPVLIRELQRMGFDVWVYTGNYMSEPALKRLFGAHYTRVNGIVNGLRKADDRKELRKAFAEKYDVSLHIDGNDVVWVNTRTREYDTINIGGNAAEWSARAISIVRQIEIVKANLKG